MDIKWIIQEVFTVIILLNLHPGLSSYMDDDYEDGPSFGRCPWIRNKLKNGRVRYRYKGRVAKFLCDSGYDLAGKRSSTCVRGQWSNPVPVCVARGCSRVPSIPNGHVTEMYRGALLVYDCNPGYTLDGAASIHCDGRRWSSGSPTCIVATENPDVSCDFESPDLCGWTHDPNHEFDWKRNQFSTPSGHVGTGPSYDHTFGENKGGYYLYIEASSPRKINDTARLFSPVYSAGLSGGCFILWYHMYGATTGGLRVYLKPESHVFDELLPKWERTGDQGDKWIRGNISIPVLHENFQIVIEGIRGESYVGDSAIDDVSLTSLDCARLENFTEIVEHTNADSCRGRCREDDSDSVCSCKDNCFGMNTCCNDYTAFCYDGNETTVPNTDEMLPEDTTSKTVSVSTTTISSRTTVNSTEAQSPTEQDETSLKSSTQISEEYASPTISQSPISVSVISFASTSPIISTSTTSPSTTFPTIANATLLTNTSLPFVSTDASTMTQATNEASTSSSAAIVTTSSIPTSSMKTTITSTTSMKTPLSSATSPKTTTMTSSSTTSSTTTSSTTTSSTTTSSTTTSSTTTGSTTTSSTITDEIIISSTPSILTSSSTPKDITISPVPSVEESTGSRNLSSPTTISMTPSSKLTTSSEGRTSGIPSTFSSMINASLIPQTETSTISTTSSTTSNTSPNTIFSETTLTPSSAVSVTTKSYNLRPRTQRTTLGNPSTVNWSTENPSRSVSVTTDTSTRKTYYIRPRPIGTRTSTSKVTYTTGAMERISRTTGATSISEKSTVPSQEYKTPLFKSNITFWHKTPISYATSSTKYVAQTTVPSTSMSTVKPSVPYGKFGKPIKISTASQIFPDATTKAALHYSTTISSNEMGSSKAESKTGNGSTPIVITLVAIIIAIIGGVAFYMKRQRNKRQSKLSDDSEMRFLQENDYMDYSDASALDKILVK